MNTTQYTKNYDLLSYYKYKYICINTLSQIKDKMYIKYVNTENTFYVCKVENMCIMYVIV